MSYNNVREWVICYKVVYFLISENLQTILGCNFMCKLCLYLACTFDHSLETSSLESQSTGLWLIVSHSLDMNGHYFCLYLAVWVMFIHWWWRVRWQECPKQRLKYLEALLSLKLLAVAKFERPLLCESLSVNQCLQFFPVFQCPVSPFTFQFLSLLLYYGVDNHVSATETATLTGTECFQWWMEI